MNTNMRMMIGLGVVALVATAWASETEKNELVDRLLEVMRRVPDKWPLQTNKTIAQGQENVQRQEIIIHVHPVPPSIEARANDALQYAKTNGIPLGDVLEAAKAQVKKSCAMLEDSYPKTPSSEERNARYKWMRIGEGSPDETTRYTWMLAVLVATGDLSSLPLIEEMHRSPNTQIREDAIRTYLRLAGTNAVSFRTLIANNRYAESELTPPLFQFFQELKRTPDINDENILFLFEVMEKSSDACNAKQADDVLCEKLPGYSNSVQRLAVAKRYSEKGITTLEALSYYDFIVGFIDIKKEIEKIPENQRKDFRAKGELLDPDRKKEP